MRELPDFSHLTPVTVQSKNCAECQKPFASGEAMYRAALYRQFDGVYNGPRGYAMLCEKCTRSPDMPKWQVEEISHCQQCGRAVHYLHQLQHLMRFCCDACRIKAQTAHQKDHQKRVLYTRDCEYCAQEFESYRADAKTCSDACRVALHRLNRKP